MSKKKRYFMKKDYIGKILSAILGALILSVGSIWADAKSPNMKMTTEIPESIIMQDKIKTRIGTLEFFDGFPTETTVKKAYDFLDFQRGVDVFLDEMRATSMVALREGHLRAGNQ
jgi:hypothetical protein